MCRSEVEQQDGLLLRGGFGEVVDRVLKPACCLAVSASQQQGVAGKPVEPRRVEEVEPRGIGSGCHERILGRADTSKARPRLPNAGGHLGVDAVQPRTEQRARSIARVRVRCREVVAGRLYLPGEAGHERAMAQHCGGQSVILRRARRIVRKLEELFGCISLSQVEEQQPRSEERGLGDGGCQLS